MSEQNNTTPQNTAPVSQATASGQQATTQRSGGYASRPGQRFDRNSTGGRPGFSNPNERGAGRGGFHDGRRSVSGNGERRTFGSKKPRNDKRPRQEEQTDIEAQLIEVKRVTRVVKGGKRMRFAALVVVGDRKGQVGMGFMKGMDFQDAVAKATRKAKENLIKVTITEDGSVAFPLQFKYKSAQLYLKPANKGTGLIAGGYLRPVLELAGVENVYTKIIGSKNKIAGVQAVIQALQKYNK